MNTSDLPQSVQSFFSNNEEIYQGIKPLLENPTQFPETHTPSEIDILFDDVVCGTISNGSPGINIICAPISEEPDTFEIQFDGEPALFIIHGHEVINRLDNMHSLDLHSSIEALANH